MEHVPLVLLPTSSESIIYGDCYSISYGTSGKKLLSLLFRTSLKRTNLFAQENNQSFWCGSNSLTVYESDMLPTAPPLLHNRWNHLRINPLIWTCLYISFAMNPHPGLHSVPKIRNAVTNLGLMLTWFVGLVKIVNCSITAGHSVLR